MKIPLTWLTVAQRQQQQQQRRVVVPNLLPLWTTAPNKHGRLLHSTTGTTARSSTSRTGSAAGPHRLAAVLQGQFSSSSSSSAALFSTTTTTNKNNSMSGEEILAAFPPRPTQGLNVALAMHALVHADAVCFDVDSTVIAEEGIDVLAAFLGKGEQVSALTRAAMEGGMPFQDALAARLDLLQPSRRQIERCLQEHPFSLTPGVERLVQALHQTGKAVHLVSGGFRIMIEPIAQKLNINPVTHVVANQIVFDSDDLYAGFDTKEPTSQDMGKPRALSHIQQSHHYKTMLMIGDGATDAQAKPPAAAFVGFGGVVVRPSVQAQADWFVTDFDDMTYLLETFCK